MKTCLELKELKKEINRRKIELNNLAKGNLREDNIIKLSKELDLLINQFHTLELKKP